MVTKANWLGSDSYDDVRASPLMETLLKDRLKDLNELIIAKVKEGVGASAKGCGAGAGAAAPDEKLGHETHVHQDDARAAGLVLRGPGVRRALALQPRRAAAPRVDILESRSFSSHLARISLSRLGNAMTRS